MSADTPRPPETLAPLLTMTEPKYAALQSIESAEHNNAIDDIFTELHAQRAALATVTQEKLTLAAITERADRRASDAIQRAEQAEADLATARARVKDLTVQQMRFRGYLDHAGRVIGGTANGHVIGWVDEIGFASPFESTEHAQWLDEYHKTKEALTADAAARSGKE